MIVGKKTGKDAKETLIEKKIKAWSHGIGLDRVLTNEEDLILASKAPFSPSWSSTVLWFSCACSSSRRSLATFRSLTVRYRADSGESGMKYHANIAVMMLGNPSKRKTARQDSMGPFCVSLTIIQARVLAKLVARGAAEI